MSGAVVHYAIPGPIKPASALCPARGRAAGELTTLRHAVTCERCAAICGPKCCCADCARARMPARHVPLAAAS